MMARSLRGEVLMVDQKKITDKAAEVAGAAAAAAAPMAKHAKDRAAGIADRAGELGAKGVSAVAEGIDAVTRGKFSNQISAVTSRIEDALDPDDPVEPKKD